MIRSLNALEECRNMVAMRLTDYQQRLAWGYNRKVKPQEFVPEDLTLRRPLEAQRIKVLVNWPRTGNGSTKWQPRPGQDPTIWKIWKKDPCPDYRMSTIWRSITNECNGIYVTLVLTCKVAKTMEPSLMSFIVQANHRVLVWLFHIYFLLRTEVWLSLTPVIDQMETTDQMETLVTSSKDKSLARLDPGTLVTD